MIVNMQILGICDFCGFFQHKQTNSQITIAFLLQKGRCTVTKVKLT